MSRHPGVTDLLRFFETGHLPTNLSSVAVECRTLALNMAARLPDSAELTTGLRKLLEAKDCFVRAALSNGKDS